MLYNNRRCFWSLRWLGFCLVVWAFIQAGNANVIKREAPKWEHALTDSPLGRAFRGAADGFRWIEVEAPSKEFQFPLTFECRAKLSSKNQFHILAANETKESGTHWEVYTYSGSGFFSAYCPGYTPAEIVSQCDVTDGVWHYLAAVFDGESVALYVDAREVTRVSVKRNETIQSIPGRFTIGVAFYSGGTIGCDGLIDEVRLTKGVRDITSLPTASLEADRLTFGLWKFNEVKRGGAIKDHSQANHAGKLTIRSGPSMDELDRISYNAGPSPADSAARKIQLHKGRHAHSEGPPMLLLDGKWELAEGGDESIRLSSPWNDSIPIEVPGSVHTALVKAGIIPNPTIGLNDAFAREKSFKNWWYKRSFSCPAGINLKKLVFDGVAVDCSVWLNGTRLGSHKGMFGGPEFDIARCVRDDNTLIVKIDPAPYVKGLDTNFGAFFNTMNVGWIYTVVFNNVYGWHYSNIPALGIWRSVRIESEPVAAMVDPFVFTRHAKTGTIELCAELRGNVSGWSGVLNGTILPENRLGDSYHFSLPVRSATESLSIHLQMSIPDPCLWWPNGLGEPNLYRMILSIDPGVNGTADRREIVFGIRTIEMAPLPDGPRSDKYNWTFTINETPVFVKGTGWCTMDPLMDFSRFRINRLLTLAKDQNVQMLRAWGSGMPETDDFYNLCDRYGIMVLQEWPTAWNSHKEGWQPYDVLEETVRLNTIRLRNHPALVMWGGGNESSEPFGKAIDMMGRFSIELDGTRPFHRGEPWGGSAHNYNCYWGRQPLDHNLTMTADFWGEFGIASVPVYESVLRYLPDDEKNVWPVPEDGSFAHHTPVFNTMECMSRLTQYSGYFSVGKTMQEFIHGSQLAQAVGVRHTLERARTRWPFCTGALYYKLNDNYPAASWSSVDWYGAPKIGHYFYQDSFEPLHACILFDTVHTAGKPFTQPVFLLDDADELRHADWRIHVRAYNSQLHEIKFQDFIGSNSIDRVKKLGDFTLTSDQTNSIPLLFTIEVIRDGELVDRTFYFINFEEKQDSLFDLPKTTLDLAVQNGRAVVTNTGELPAVGVHVLSPDHADTFRIDDNYFWLCSGESKTLSVNQTDGLTVSAWNNGKD